MRMILGSLFLALLLLSNPVLAQTLVLNTADEFPRSTPDGKGYEDLIIAEACKRMGLGVTIVHLPSERALVNANQGIDDGNFVRIAGLEKSYPNLVMVPEKITSFEFTVFTKDPSLRISGWDSLKPYSVGLITGWKILEMNITGTRALTKVDGPAALFSLLVRDRADLVVIDREQGNAILKKLGIAGIVALSPPLARREMFLYLNRRHAGIVPRLAETLREMKQDGAFDQIVHTVMKEME